MSRLLAFLLTMVKKSNESKISDIDFIISFIAVVMAIFMVVVWCQHGYRVQEAWVYVSKYADIF